MKSVSKLMLMLVLVCLSPVMYVNTQATADNNIIATTEAGARIFNYHLKMESVDTFHGARPYPSDTDLPHELCHRYVSLTVVS